MLGNEKLMAFVGTADRERAKTFYADILGLRLVDENPFALVFDANGISLRVTTVESVVPRSYTVLGWDVTDVFATVQQLEKAGVNLTRYPGLDQDDSGVWTAPGGAKVAWFEDPDGNVLSVAQS